MLHSFSSWELDHRIERHVIIKRLVGAVKTLSKAPRNDPRKINIAYFYSLLFEEPNVVLVSKLCHYQGSHNLACNENLIYLNQ